MLEVGESTTLFAEFFDATGALADPTGITLTITAPDGTVTTKTIADLIHASVGRYEWVLLVDQAGIWTYRFDGTGAVTAGETAILQVFPIGTVAPTSPCEPWICWGDLPCAIDLSGLPGGAGPNEAAVIDYVSEVMWRLSCEQYGICTITAWPLRECRCGHRSWGYRGGRYGRECRCGHYEFLLLGAEPIVQVDDVTIDGVVLAPTSYRVDEFHRLVRTDGNIWPPCNRLELDGPGIDSWHVTWKYGVAVPPGGVLAAGLYACEVAKALIGEECELPPGTTSASRDGVTVNIIDTAEAVASGKTGVLLTDMWLETVCPGGPSKAMSGAMDLGRARNWLRVGT